MNSTVAKLVGDDPRELLGYRGARVALDTESTGLDYADDMIGVSLAWGNKSCYLHLPVGQLSLGEDRLPVSIDLLGLLRDLLARHVIIFHSEAYDYRLLHKHLLVDPPRHAHDLQHVAGMVAYHPSYSLASLIGQYLEDPPEWYKQMKAERGRLVQMDLNSRARYARQDAVYTLRLAEPLGERLRGDARLHALYQEDTRFIHLTMQLIQRGLPLDMDWCYDHVKAFRMRMTGIEEKLRARGLRDIRSNDQMATFLFRILGLEPRSTTRVKSHAWPEGVPSVANGVLESHRNIPEVQMIMAYDQLDHAMGTWLLPYLVESAHDGRIHSLINPFGTISHRMSAQRPNVQGIPMEERNGRAFGSMMGIFRGRDGDRLWSIDLKQAEVRMAALLSKEYLLAEIFNSGGDPYVEMSRRLWGKLDRRNDAKRATLASIYEVGVDKFANTNKIDHREAQDILYRFRDAFPRLRAASRLSATYAEQNGHVRDFWGRPRWFGPDDPWYAAFNQRVQMSVASLLRKIMLEVEEYLPGRLLLQIHDSMVLSLPKKQEKQMLTDVLHIIEAVVPERLSNMTNPPIRFPADAKLWQEEKS